MDTNIFFILGTKLHAVEAFFSLLSLKISFHRIFRHSPALDAKSCIWCEFHRRSWHGVKKSTANSPGSSLGPPSNGDCQWRPRCSLFFSSPILPSSLLLFSSSLLLLLLFFFSFSAFSSSLLPLSSLLFFSSSSLLLFYLSPLLSLFLNLSLSLSLFLFSLSPLSLSDSL